MESNPQINAGMEKVLLLLKQDPRKTSVLGVLTLVLVIMAGRVMFTGDNQPQRTFANGAGMNSGGVNGGGTNGGMNGGVNGSTSANGSSNSSSYPSPAMSGGSRDRIDQESSPAARTHNATQRMHEWLSEPIKPPTRNLFVVKLEYFPSDGSRAPQASRSASDGEFWGELEKSLSIQADQKDKRDNLLANYRTEAGKLRLDSIMWGAQPKAMIEGKLVAEGDVVASFRVLKIEPRRIIVEREGIKLEIQMK